MSMERRGVYCSTPTSRPPVSVRRGPATRPDPALNRIRAKMDIAYISALSVLALHGRRTDLWDRYLAKPALPSQGRADRPRTGTATGPLQGLHHAGLESLCRSFGDQ